MCIIKKRLYSIMAIIAMVALICVSLSVASALSSDNDKTIVIACSDFQNPKTKAGDYNSYKEGIENIQSVLRSIQGKYPTVNGFICGGDYCKEMTNHSQNDTNVGLKALKTAIKGIYSDIANMIFVKGNHDNPNADVTSYGAHDCGKYSVYVLNEDHYPEGSSSNRDKEGTIKNTAREIDTYLTNLVKKSYDKPVFFSSHVPLHYSMRTVNNNDALYAHYIFDVLNKYGDKLNIFFMYGHNHNHGYDDYMGGNAQFLKAGDDIFIANDRYNYEAQKLNFTYMNYGYIGFYIDDEDKNYTTEGVDAELTMTSFEIVGNKVTVNRWDKDGVHTNLKSCGVHPKYNGKKNTDKMTINEKVYTSPQVIDFNSVNSDKKKELDNSTDKVGTEENLKSNDISTNNNQDLHIETENDNITQDIVINDHCPVNNMEVNNNNNEFDDSSEEDYNYLNDDEEEDEDNEDDDSNIITEWFGIQGSDNKKHHHKHHENKNYEHREDHKHKHSKKSEHKHHEKPKMQNPWLFNFWF